MTDVPRRLPPTPEERLRTAAGQTHAALSGRGSVASARPVVVSGAVAALASNDGSAGSSVSAWGEYWNSGSPGGSGRVPFAIYSDYGISQYVSIDDSGDLQLLAVGYYQFSAYAGMSAGGTLQIKPTGVATPGVWAPITTADSNGDAYCCSIPVQNLAEGNLLTVYATAASVTGVRLGVVKLA